MKLPLALSFFVALIQFGTSNVISKREILLSDAIAVQNGSDVKMVKPGPLEVVLNNASELNFGVCEQNCNGVFFACFEGAFNDSWSTDLCDSKCGFYVDTNENDVTYMTPFSEENWGLPRKNCTEMIMRDKETTQTGELPLYPSCLPKVENGIVKLNIINATSDCVVTVKNAKIKPEEITPSPNSPANPAPKNPTNSPSNDPSSAAANIIGSFGWIFVFISFYILCQ